MLSLRAVVQFNYLTAELIAGACRVSNYKALYELGHHYGNSDSRSSKIVSKSLHSVLEITFLWLLSLNSTRSLVNGIKVTVPPPR